MPHKHNPVLSERICGMARVLRGHAVTALEDVALWHERDISHSSAERIVLPNSCALLDYMLRLCARVVLQVRVNPGKMLQDVETLGRITCSPRVLDALIGAGWSRERAYREVQALAERARAGEAGFEALVRSGWRPTWRRRCWTAASTSPPTSPASISPTAGSGSRSASRSRGRRPRSVRSSPSRRGSEEAIDDPGADDGAGRRAGGVPPGQGARHLRSRRREPADGGDRPPLRLRRRPARPHPREGPDAHPDLALVVRADVRHRGQPPAPRSGRRGATRDLGGVAGAVDALFPGRAHRHRVRGPRSPLRLRLEGVPRPGDAGRRAAARGTARVLAAPRAPLHTGDQERHRA